MSFNKAIYLNGVYGAKVGNIQVFTKDGAIEVFRRFVRLCNCDLTMESSAVLSDVSEDMQRIGFMPEELEQIEIDTLEEASV